MQNLVWATNAMGHHFAFGLGFDCPKKPLLIFFCKAFRLNGPKYWYPSLSRNFYRNYTKLNLESSSNKTLMHSSPNF